MTPFKRYFVLVIVLVLSLGLVSVSLAAADSMHSLAVQETGGDLEPESVSAEFGAMDVNYAHDWVEMLTTPFGVVTVTVSDKAVITGTADGDGWFRSNDWEWNPQHPNIEVGDIVTSEAGGLTSFVDPVGQVNIETDFDNDIVTGSIDAPWSVPLTVTCEIWVEEGASIEVINVEPNGGEYSCNFSSWDLQPDQTIAVRYHEPDGDSVINIYDPPWMRINYAHDWVGGNYEVGHTFWFTVTESDGETVKAMGEIDTWSDGGWDGDGFETNDQHWSPNQPDIIPGDWVIFQSDDGYHNEIRVGEISGTVDVAADSVSGPIYAAWFTDTLELDVECHPWGAPDENTEGKNSDAAPDGSAPYLCQWDSAEWDILPGQDVGVMYVEPDQDRIINALHEPAPDLNIEKWSEGSGQVMPGGRVVFNIRYHNHGEVAADTFSITDTLPVNTAYLTDTAGVPASVASDQVIWTFESLEPGEESTFQLVLTYTASTGDWLHNEVDIASEYDANWDDNHAEAEVEVVDDVPDLYVNKEPIPGDPAPGQTMQWEIHYGNRSAVASGMVLLTDTLPIDTTVVDWYSESGYGVWSDYGSTDNQFVITAPTIPGHWEDRIILRLLLDHTIPIDTQMTNTVEIFTAEESSDTLEDNWHQRDDIWTSEPRWDGTIWKNMNWAQLVPGGELGYHLGIRNHGNMTTHIWLTDTLPVNTTFVEAWSYTGSSRVPFPPDFVDDDVVYWDIGGLEPGEFADIDLILAIDEYASPGTELENCAEIIIDGSDGWPSDNQDCVADSINEFGPNLRVTKNYNWHEYERLSYDIQIENIGSEWLDNIWITDTYPLFTTYSGDWWINHGPEITVTHDLASGQLIFWVDELSPGETASVGFAADLDGGIIGEQGLAFTNTVEGPIPGDINPDDNYDQVTAITGPDVYIEKWVSDGELRPGEIVTFTVEFGNRNHWPWDGDDQFGSHITETLPQAMSFITSTAPWNPEETWTPETIDGNTIAWGWGPMWSNNTWWFDLVVQITDTVEGGDVLTNQVEVFGDSPDDVEYNWDNNLYDLPLTILGANFEVTKTYMTNMVAGTDVVYTVTVTNVGSEAGTGVILKDKLPDNLSDDDIDVDTDGTWVKPDVFWSNLGSISPNGGTVSGWFSSVIVCTAGLAVVNDEYRVISSDQGVTTENGDPVSFTIIEPTIDGSFTQSTDTVNMGGQVDFTAIASTDGTALTYAWDFGDGGSGNGAAASHVYMTPGSFDVTLTVMDGCGYYETIVVENAVTVERTNFLIYLPLIQK